MNGPIVPKHIMGARRPPQACEQACKDYLDTLVRTDVIVRQDAPTEWCTGAHFVDKSNGKVRLVNDLTALNKYTLRPVHGFPSASELRKGILHTSRYFAVLDCVMGYHQLKFDEESSLLTTFMVSTGDSSQRYRFVRAPMGLNASGAFVCAHQSLTRVELVSRSRPLKNFWAVFFLR